MQTSPPRRTPLIASVVVIVILAGAFGYFYVTATGTINSLNSSITSQQGVMSAQSQSINGLQSTVSSQSSSISVLQANVTAYEQLKIMLRQIISQDTAKIASLNATVAADAAQITSLNQQITTANDAISTLTQTVNLQLSQVLLSSQSVTIYSSYSTGYSFYSFSPANAGYVLLKVSGASVNWFPECDYNPNHSNPAGDDYASLLFFNPGSTDLTYVIIPVVPGTANTFYLWSPTTSSGVATVSMTYYY